MAKIYSKEKEKKTYKILNITPALNTSQTTLQSDYLLAKFAISGATNPNRE